MDILTQFSKQKQDQEVEESLTNAPMSQDHSPFLEPITWSETSLILSESRPSLFFIGDFFLVSLDSQSPSKIYLYKPNQDTSIMPVSTTPSQLPRHLSGNSPQAATGQTGGMKVKGGHLSRAESGNI
jgi:hypothetical protein